MMQHKAGPVGMHQTTQALQVIERFCLYPMNNEKPLKGFNIRVSQSDVCLEKAALAALQGLGMGCGEKEHVNAER